MAFEIMDTQLRLLKNLVFLGSETFSKRVHAQESHKDITFGLKPINRYRTLNLIANVVALKKKIEES